MNGARALLQSLLANGVDTCFANPGTSELHVVAALDDVPGMRAVLTLFEGVATGAADGYARMAGRPAAALLHLGPGLGNGLANLHNARRAGTPLVTVIGDHATAHAPYDAPLQSDISGLAKTVSGWQRSPVDPTEIGTDAAAAVAAARAGQVATLVVPADVSWSAGAQPAPETAAGEPGAVPDVEVDPDAVRAAADAVTSGEPCVLFVGGDATGARGLAAADRIAAATGARVLAETFPARLTRGAGVAPVDRLGYAVAVATRQLAGTRHLVLAGARAPMSFFGYPDTSSDLVPTGCVVHPLAPRTGAVTPLGPATAALEALVELVAPGAAVRPAPAARPALPTGPLTPSHAAAVVGALLPEGAIVVDESMTSGLALPAATAGAPRHDWLTLTGGAIGYGLPAATGAAVACPDRPVWCLQADGSAMYTISALWTQAREGLDVTTLVYHNSAYAILRLELAQLGLAGTRAPADPAAPASRARELFDLSRPALDFVALATGMGVPAVRVTTAEGLADALRRASAEPGPHLVEAMVPPVVP